MWIFLLLLGAGAAAVALSQGSDEGGGDSRLRSIQFNPYGIAGGISSSASRTIAKIGSRFVKSFPTATPDGSPLRPVYDLSPRGKGTRSGTPGFDSKGNEIGGVPWVYSDALGNPTRLPSMGMDIEGKEWRYELDGSYQEHHKLKDENWTLVFWEKGGGSKSWSEKLHSIGVEYVLPAVATISGALVGGPAGAAIAFSLTTMSKLAKGKRVDQALFDTAVEQLGSKIESSTFYAAAKALAENSYSKPAVERLRAEITKGLTPGTPSYNDALGAFANGATLGRAKRLQDILVGEIVAQLPDEDVEVFLRAVNFWNADIRDWAFAYGGMKAVSELEKLTERISAMMDEGTI